MSDDLIKRSDAIKEIEEYVIKENEAISEHPDDIFKYNSGLLTAIQAVHDLPSADRPQGEWIDKGDYAICSNCGAKSGTQFDGVEPIPLKTNFCPHCGARMKGADDETAIS